jgi:glyoxylase-like metal-dependent hydrolase (beta-lactamase superfamily II)
MLISRLLRAATVAAAFTATTAAVGVVATTAAHAAAPMAKTSAPGYYRMVLGDFEITALSDGTVELPMNKLLTNTTPAKVDKALAKSFLKSPVETSVNAYLVNTGNKLILVDAGAGTLFGPTLGKLLANLKASGYQPEQVDEVYLTHIHPDHAGGLMTADKLAFPNAIVRVDKRDSDFWLSEENMDKAPADAKGFFQGAMASLNPYAKADRLKPFTSGIELSPGIKAVSTPGHTVGHNAFVIESKGQKLALWGDLVHVASLQFEKPEIAIQFDSDSKSAVAHRKKAFNEAVRQGYLVAGAHLPFPGIGHVRADGKGYTWVPVNYSPMR